MSKDLLKLLKTPRPSFMEKPRFSWKEMKQQLDESLDFIRGVRVEEKYEAIYDYGPSVEEVSTTGETIQNRHPQTIPYRKSVDMEGLKAEIEYAKQLGYEITKLLEKEKLTMELLQLWGQFQYFEGLILAVYRGKNEDLPQERQKRKDKEDQTEEQTIWASAFLDAATTKHGLSKKGAVALLESRVQDAIIYGRYNKVGFSPLWFEPMVNRHPETGKITLKSTYGATNIYKESKFPDNVALYKCNPKVYPLLDVTT